MSQRSHESRSSSRTARMRLMTLLFAAFVSVAGAQTPPAARSGGNTTALEVLQRLKGMDIEASPALKGAVLRVLESTRGTAQFVEIVRDFSLTGQEAGLLEVAVNLPGESAGADAVRVLLKAGGASALEAALADTGGEAGRRLALVRALANALDPAGVSLLVGMLTHATSDGAIKSAAVHGLAGSEAGARALLGLARDSKLEDAQRSAAALDLAQSRWPAVREEARKILPPPRTADGGELPPMGELVKLKGDAVNGAKVFRDDRAACIKCHRVGGEGIDFGPALTEIGTKLAPQALYESILDPSAGIAFGFEAWSVERRDGEEVFGLIASETAEELAIKQQTGVVVRLKKTEVSRRDKQKLSIMPAGLAQILTRQELVDVVAYLASLKSGAK